MFDTHTTNPSLPKPDSDSLTGAHPGNAHFLGDWSLLWGVLAVAVLLLAYPLGMLYLGDTHGLRYLLRLGGSLLLVPPVILVGWLLHWSPRR